MAWSTHPTVVTGQTWSASDQNTYVKANLDYLFSGLSQIVGNRQGGSTSSWFTVGTTNYTVTTPVLQTGYVNVVVGGGSDDATTAVTFPVAFSKAPLVFMTTSKQPAASNWIFLWVQSVSTTQVTLAVRAPERNITVPVEWLAVGE